MNSMWKVLANYTNAAPSSDIRLSPVSEAEILAAEHRLGRPFPEPLKTIWRTIGYGRIGRSLDGAVRVDHPSSLMHPADVAAACLGVDDYEQYKFPGEGIPFFDVGDLLFIVLDQKPDGTWAVRDCFDSKWENPLADSAEEFLNRLLEDPKFHYPLDQGSNC